MSDQIEPTQADRDAVGIVPLANPERCPGCYVMHFYCKYRNPDHPWQRDTRIYMEESEGVETRTAAIRQIRKAGWLYHNDGTATCPRCAKAIRALAEASTTTKGEG